MRDPYRKVTGRLRDHAEAHLGVLEAAELRTHTAVDPGRTHREAQHVVLAGYDVASAETRHHEIEDVVLSVVREAAREWGLDVRRVELGAIEPAPPGTPGTARTLDTTD